MPRQLTITLPDELHAFLKARVEQVNRHASVVEGVYGTQLTEEEAVIELIRAWEAEVTPDAHTETW